MKFVVVQLRALKVEHLILAQTLPKIGQRARILNISNTMITRSEMFGNKFGGIAVDN